MATSAVCPKCAAVATFYRPPASSCPHCAAPFPDALRAQIEATLGRERAPKPLLLVVGTYGSLFVGTIMLAFLLLAPFDLGTYSIENEEVSGPEFLRQVGFMWASLAACILAIGYALWRELSWSRPLMLAYWFLNTLAVAAVNREAPIGNLIVQSLIFLALTMGIAGAYLYANEAAVAYYKALQASEEAGNQVAGQAAVGRGA